MKLVSFRAKAPLALSDFLREDVIWSMPHEPINESIGWRAARGGVPVVACVALGFAALAVDLPWARWLTTQPFPSVLHKLILLSEVFAHASGVAMILLAVWLLDVKNRRAIPRLLGASFGAGLLADVFKTVIVRIRPQAFPLSDTSKTVADTFGDWFPGFRGGFANQSFPSAHLAVAAGLAIGLSRLYPRGRFLWFTLAVLAACQRWVDSAHYLSDTLWGAAIGIAVGQLCFLGWNRAACDVTSDFKRDLPATNLIRAEGSLRRAG